MSNQLCDPGTQECVGFPAGDASCPSGPVYCLAGNLVVQNYPTCKGYEIQTTEGSGQILASPGPNTYSSTQVDLVMVNPFCVEAIVGVSHEFALSYYIADTDSWAWEYTVSITGGTLFGGGTTFAGTLWSRAVFANSDLVELQRQQGAFRKLYVVAANTAFTVSQTSRVVTANIFAPAARSIATYYNTMRAEIQQRVT